MRNRTRGGGKTGPKGTPDFKCSLSPSFSAPWFSPASIHHPIRQQRQWYPLISVSVPTDRHSMAPRSALESWGNSLTVCPSLSSPVSSDPSELRGDETLDENKYHQFCFLKIKKKSKGQKWWKNISLAFIQKTNLESFHVVAETSPIIGVWRPLNNSETDQCSSAPLLYIKRFKSISHPLYSLLDPRVYA